MKICCDHPLPEGASYCPFCGKRQTETTRRPRVRGNGQGSVYKLPNGKWMAERTLGYHLKPDEDKLVREKNRKSFSKKKDALDWLHSMASLETRGKEWTFGQLYEAWLPTHRASKSTINCYTSAARYLRPVWLLRMKDLSVDDLQACLDECPHGKRTRQNMKAVVGLVYKYGIPRKAVPDNLNLGPFLRVTAEDSVEREAIPQKYVDRILAAAGTVPYADYVACQCFLGFRPSEFLGLMVEGYNRKERAFRGGAKTEAGTNRVVTVSPKIAPLVDRLIGERTSGPVFCGPDGKALSLQKYTGLFYDVLDAVGLENPVEDINGVMKHRYTPHSCRHSFATMMKRVGGSDRDKLSLIGHSSDAMLRHYQSVDYDDLRRITNAL